MAKYRCPKCDFVFEDRPDRCPNCNVKMTYPNPPHEEEVVLDEEKKELYDKRNRFLGLKEDENVLYRGKIVNLPWVYLSVFFFLIGLVALVIGIVNRVNHTNLWFRNLYWLLIAGAGILLGVFFIVLFLAITTRLTLTNKRVIVNRGAYLHSSIKLDDITYVAKNNGLITIDANGKSRRLYYVNKAKKVYDLLCEKVVQ